MKKRALLCLMVLMLLRAQAFASLSPTDVETEIALLAHYSWDYTVEESQAYFTAAGYSVTIGFLFEGDIIEGVKKKGDDTLFLGSLGIQSTLLFLGVTFPSPIRRADLLSAVVLAFGESTHPSRNFWKLEGGSSLSVSEEGETQATLYIMPSDESSQNEPPRSGRFSSEALRIVENARAAADGAFPAQSEAPAASGEDTRDPSAPFYREYPM